MASGQFDIIVAGGGPAGVSAAVAAARAGRRVLLLERQGCLGGVWTAGLLSYVFDFDKSGIDKKMNDAKAAGNSGGVAFRPFQIPLRSCIAKDADNLFMAGRCISGDFYAQASYRVTGSAVAMGEAVGKAAAGGER